jgi:uncharacterized protein (TIGR00255 family)
MLLSMTGFGEGHRQQGPLTVSVELRTINSRYFKLTLRCPEGYNALEPQLEAVLRERIKRGTVQVNLRIDRERRPDDFQLNLTVLGSYYRQLEALRRDLPESGPVNLAAALTLPGVVSEQTASWSDAAGDWALIEQALLDALARLELMRADEGRAMTTDLRANATAIAAQLGEIERRSPLVVESFRSRLSERLKKALAEYNVELDASDLIREVSIYAERSDISEEVVRLRSHLEQFEAFLEAPESAGRKLEFLTQELFREANTIGSKAGDLEIARAVIEVKAGIERIREMIQNVE